MLILLRGGCIVARRVLNPSDRSAKATPDTLEPLVVG